MIVKGNEISKRYCDLSKATQKDLNERSLTKLKMFYRKNVRPNYRFLW